MKKIIFVYIGLVVIVILLAAWRLGAFGFFAGLGGGGDTAEVKIDDQTVQVDVADDDEQRTLGLGGRESLEADRGMLFVFEEKEIQTFWMKDMQFPIDIIFINDNVIVGIESNVQPPEGDDPNLAALPLYRPDEPVNYVLEVPAGYAEEKDWEVGNTVEISGL